MNGYQDNSSRKNACRSGMPLMSCPVAGISGNRCINTAPPTCPPEIPCAGSVHLVSEMGHFARRVQKSDLPARIRRQEGTGRRRHFWEAEIIRSAWDMYRFSPGSSRMRWKPHFRRGTNFPDLDLPVYDGRCLLMNETAEIDETD